jgi:ribosomal protein S21
MGDLGDIDPSVERMIRRFTRSFRKDVLPELRKRRGYLKPSEARRLKSALARSRRRRELRKGR